VKKIEVAGRPRTDANTRNSRAHLGPKGRFSLPESLRLRNSGVMYVLAMLLVIFAVLSSVRGQAGYLSPENLGNIADQAAPIGILAVFMTVVLISGNFDLSVASVAALSAVVSLLMVDVAGPVLAIVTGLAISAVLGLTNGLLVQGLGINAFVVTLGMLTAARSLVLIVSGGNSIVPTNHGITEAVSGNIKLNFGLLLIVGGVLCLGSTMWQVRRRHHMNPVTLVLVGVLGVFGVAIGAALYWGSSFVFTTQLLVLVVLTVIVAFVLRFTRLGRQLYAVGGNAEAARLPGFRLVAIKLFLSS